MGPITYSLCQKPIIGTVMWLTSLCGFPPLFTNVSISLDKAGTSVSVPFTVPVDKDYSLSAKFEFPSVEERVKDQRFRFGRNMPFRLVIKNESGKLIVADQTYNSLDCNSHSSEKLSCTIGSVELKQGNYIAEVTSLKAQSDVGNIKTSISLTSGRWLK